MSKYIRYMTSFPQLNGKVLKTKRERLSSRVSHSDNKLSFWNHSNSFICNAKSVENLSLYLKQFIHSHVSCNPT